MNNRLDFISDIDKDGIYLMTVVRAAYIHIDECLMEFINNSRFPLDAAASRTLELARTNLEISLQYVIKTLCLQYEIKE